MRNKRLIQFYITDHCNSKCETCNIWCKKENFNELSPKAIMDVVNSNWNADFVIGGGEAILHPNIRPILIRLEEAQVNYTLLSNCLKPAYLYDLAAEHNIPNVTISFDGIRHDIIRGSKGNTEKIREFLSLVRYNHDGVRPNVKLSYTYSKHNSDCFIQDMDYIKNVLMFDKVYFCLAQDMSLLKSGYTFIENNLGVIFERLDMLYDRDCKTLKNFHLGNYVPCDSTNSVYTIYSNGDIVRCQSYMSKDVLGNVYKDNFNKVVEDSANKDFCCPHENNCKLLCQRRYD